MVSNDFDPQVVAKKVVLQYGKVYDKERVLNIFKQKTGLGFEIPQLAEGYVMYQYDKLGIEPLNESIIPKKKSPGRPRKPRCSSCGSIIKEDQK